MSERERERGKERERELGKFHMGFIRRAATANLLGVVQSLGSRAWGVVWCRARALWSSVVVWSLGFYVGLCCRVVV